LLRGGNSTRGMKSGKGGQGKRKRNMLHGEKMCSLARVGESGVCEKVGGGNKSVLGGLISALKRC